MDDNWRHKTPQTQFWVREADDWPRLGLSYEVGWLLIEEGFWKACQRQLPDGPSYRFNGPFEGGSIETEESDQFISVVDHFIPRYEGLEDTVHQPSGRKLDGTPTGYVETTPDEMLAALRNVRALAVDAGRLGAQLNFEY